MYVGMIKNLKAICRAYLGKKKPSVEHGACYLSYGTTGVSTAGVRHVHYGGPFARFENTIHVIYRDKVVVYFPS